MKLQQEYMAEQEGEGEEGEGNEAEENVRQSDAPRQKNVKQEKGGKTFKTKLAGEKN